jgi:hypothetical protein
MAESRYKHQGLYLRKPRTLNEKKHNQPDEEYGVLYRTKRSSRNLVSDWDDQFYKIDRKRTKKSKKSS